jgi:hypothetical protein
VFVTRRRVLFVKRKTRVYWTTQGAGRRFWTDETVRSYGTVGTSAEWCKLLGLSNQLLRVEETINDQSGEYEEWLSFAVQFWVLRLGDNRYFPQELVFLKVAEQRNVCIGIVASEENT